MSLYAYEHDGEWHGLQFGHVQHTPDEPTDHGWNARTLCGVVPSVGEVARANQRITCWECLLADMPAVEQREAVAV